MSTQNPIVKADFSDLNFEHFCFDFSMFLKYHFSDLSKIKALVSAYEKTLPKLIISRQTFLDFLSTFLLAFNLKVNLPKFPPIINFFNFSILV